jgi:hypothetical protein
MQGSDSETHGSTGSLDARHGLLAASGHNAGATEAPREARRKSPPHAEWCVQQHTSAKRSRHGNGEDLHVSDEPPQINSRSVSMESDLSVDASDFHSWSQTESLVSSVSYCGTEPEGEPRRSAGKEGAALSFAHSYNAPSCYGWPSQGQAPQKVASIDGGCHQSKAKSDSQHSPGDTKTFLDGRIQQLSQGYGQQQQQRRKPPHPQPHPQLVSQLQKPPPKQNGPPKPDLVASDWNALDDEEFSVGPGRPRQVGFVVHVKGDSSI